MGKERPKRLYPYDDFEAEVRLYPASRGGRQTPVANGIRWDFEYRNFAFEDVKQWMIWPDFLHHDGTTRSSDEILPVDVAITSAFTVVRDKNRELVHRENLTVGTRFYLYEGPRRVGEGIVTKITGMFDPRPA